MGEVSGPLLQGDLIRSVPLPYLEGTNDRILLSVKGKQQPTDLKASPPTSTLCDDAQDKAFVIGTNSSHVLVLSQSCDLQRIEDGDTNQRIVVAPLIDESQDENIQNNFKASQIETLGRTAFAAALGIDKNAEAMFSKSRESIEKSRDSYLRSIWLGHVEGAFPLAAAKLGSFVLPRMTCYFSFLVSLPEGWYPLLKERRILRIEPHWRSVLQESLARYFGRFAFPGTEADRLAVGGVGPKAAPEAVREALPVEPAKT